jgi:hypothetical protein
MYNNIKNHIFNNAVHLRDIILTINVAYIPKQLEATDLCNGIALFFTELQTEFLNTALTFASKC